MAASTQNRREETLNEPDGNRTATGTIRGTEANPDLPPGSSTGAGMAGPAIASARTRAGDANTAGRQRSTMTTWLVIAAAVAILAILSFTYFPTNNSTSGVSGSTGATQSTTDTGATGITNGSSGTSGAGTGTANP